MPPFITGRVSSKGVCQGHICAESRMTCIVDTDKTLNQESNFFPKGSQCSENFKKEK